MLWVCDRIGAVAGVVAAQDDELTVVPTDAVERGQECRAKPDIVYVGGRNHGELVVDVTQTSESQQGVLHFLRRSRLHGQGSGQELFRTRRTGYHRDL